MNLLKFWQVGFRPSLIVGHGRSGTTWVGNVAAKARRVLYYFEPAAPNISGEGGMDTWFRYTPPKTSDPIFEAIFDPVFLGLPPTGRGWRRARYHRLLPGYRVVVKDVAGLMSTAWLTERYNPTVTILVRHPCPTILSEIRQQIPVEASRQALLAQELLFEDHLEPYRRVIEQARTPFEIFAAIWAARYRVIANTLNDYPQWKLVSYEDLCCEPLEEFQSIFRHAGLPWTPAVEQYIQFSSTSQDTGMYSGIRVSQKQVTAWKAHITAQQAAEIQQTVEAFDLPFYREQQDWDLLS